MPDGTSTSSSRRPAAFLAALALAAAGHLAASRYVTAAALRDVLEPVYADPFVQREARIETAERGATFVLGSSSFGQALEWEALPPAFPGRRFVRIIAPGMNPAQYWSEVRRVLRKQPAAILLMVHFSELDHDFLAAEQAHYFVHPGMLPAIVRHLGWRRAWRERWKLAEAFIARGSLLFRFRGHLRYALGVAKEPPWDEGDTPAPPPGIELLQTEFLSRYLDEIGKAGVPILLLEGPAHPATPAAKAMAARRTLQEMAASRGLTFISNERYGFLSASDFSGRVHLNERGREKFTRHLIATLAAWPGFGSSKGI